VLGDAIDEVLGDDVVGEGLGVGEGVGEGLGLEGLFSWAGLEDIIGALAVI